MIKSFLFRNPSHLTIQVLCQKKLFSSVFWGQCLLLLRSDILLFHPPSYSCIETIYLLFFKSDLSVLFNVLDGKSDFFSFSKIKQCITTPLLNMQEEQLVNELASLRFATKHIFLTLQHPTACRQRKIPLWKKKQVTHRAIEALLVMEIFKSSLSLKSDFQAIYSYSGYPHWNVILFQALDIPVDPCLLSTHL